MKQMPWSVEEVETAPPSSLVGYSAEIHRRVGS